MNGIKITNSQRTTLRNNIVRRIANAIVFEGNCGSVGNVMDYNNLNLYKRGLLLRRITIQNGGITEVTTGKLVGTGSVGLNYRSTSTSFYSNGASATSPNWPTTSTSPFSHTLVEYTPIWQNANLCNLYVTNTSGQVPTINSLALIGPIAYGYPITYAIGNLPATLFNTSSIATQILQPTCVAAGSNGTDLNNNGAGTPAEMVVEDADEGTITDIINDLELQEETNDERLIYLQQESLYKELRYSANTDSLLTDSIIAQFYNDRENGSMGIYVHIGEKIMEGNRAQAIQLLNLSPIENLVQAKLHKFYELFIYYNFDDTLPMGETEVSELLNIANLCPKAWGDVVYMARSLYNAVAEKPISFDESCQDPNARTRAEEYIELNEKDFEEENVEIFAPFSNNITIKPNPNNGSFVVECATKITELTVFDILGNEVYKVKESNQNKVDLKLNLSQGLYFIKLLDDLGSAYTCKFIVSN